MNPLIISLSLYVSGILIGYFFKPPTSLLPVISLLSIFLVAGYLSQRFKRPKIKYFLFLILFFLGIFRIQSIITPIDELPSYHLTNYLTKNPTLTKSFITFIAKIISPPEYFPQRRRLCLDIQRIILPEKNLMTAGIVQLNWYHPQNICNYYDTVKISAKIQFPKEYKNPGAFSYSDYLRQKNIYATGTIKTLSQIIPARKIPLGRKILKTIYQIRTMLSKKIECATPFPDSCLLQALLLGERQKISKYIKFLFNEAGIAHLLAISGLHLTLLTMIIFQGLRFIIKTSPHIFYEKLTTFIKPTNLALLLSLPFPIFYTILTGNKISTIRASIMVIIYFTSFLLEKEKKLIPPLLFTAFILLLWLPEWLFHLDFQLTFLASGGIIILLESRSPLPKRNKNFFIFCIKEYLLYPLYLSLLTFIILCPMIIYYFNLFSPIGILMNILSVPLVSGILLLSIIAGLITPLCPPLANQLFYLGGLLSRIIVTLSQLATSIPGAFLYVPSPSKLFLFIFYSSLIPIFILHSKLKLLRPQNIPFFLPIFLCLFLFLIHPIHPHNTHINKAGPMEITFLDVGKGDACFIKTPMGKTILIDGGGTYNNEFDIGRYVIAPFLWRKNIKKVDLIILSHPHPDHLNGLLFILKNFRVNKLWKTSDSSKSLSYQIFKEIIKRKHIPVTIVQKGKKEAIDKVLLEVFSPKKQMLTHSTELRSSREENNRSLVIKLSFGQISFLFTGDIEKEAEKSLLGYGKQLKSTIIKVPHHGSKNSSTKSFLELISPQIAVFSARQYGNQLFPYPQTIARYQNLSCKIYRTDLDGAITIYTDGKTYSVVTEENQRKKIVD